MGNGRRAVDTAHAELARQSEEFARLPMMMKLAAAAALADAQLAFNRSVIAELDRLGAEVERLKGGK